MISTIFSASRNSHDPSVNGLLIGEEFEFERGQDAYAEGMVVAATGGSRALAQAGSGEDGTGVAAAYRQPRTEWKKGPGGRAGGKQGTVEGTAKKCGVKGGGEPQPLTVREKTSRVMGRLESRRFSRPQILVGTQRRTCGRQRGGLETGVTSFGSGPETGGARRWQ